MGQVGELITWHNLTGVWPTTAELREHLAPFDLHAVLVGLARISAHLGSWLNHPDRDRQLAIVKRMLPTYAGAISQLYAANPRRVVVARTSILFVAKQALLTCPLDGVPVSRADEERLGICFLMANDLLLARLPQAGDATIDKAANLLTFSVYVPQDTYPFDIGRTLLLVNDVAPQLAARPDYRDLAAEFTLAAKLTPQHFCALVFAAATKFITNTLDPADPNLLLLDRAYFTHTSVPADELTAFLAQHTTTIDALKIDAAASQALDNDFILFQHRPLIALTADQYLCIDPGFLLEKAGRSFYWTLHVNTPGPRRKHLLGYWTTVVDRYVQWLAEQTYRGAGTLLPTRYFPDGAEAGDLIIRERNRLLIFEVKASTLTADAKYGFNSALLKDELQRKAIEGEGDQRKGIAQLHHNIARFLDGATIDGVHRDQIGMIYPILVFLDDAFLGPYLTDLYREHFNRDTLRRRNGPRITALHVMTLNDLQHLLAYTGRHPLSDIIEDYYHHNRHADGRLAMGSFGHARIPLLQGEPPGDDPVRERFRQFADELKGYLFPGDDDEGP